MSSTESIQNMFQARWRKKSGSLSWKKHLNVLYRKYNFHKGHSGLEQDEGDVGRPGTPSSVLKSNIAFKIMYSVQRPDVSLMASKAVI